MKRRFDLVLIILLFWSALSSCEKISVGTDASYLEGRYILQQVKIVFLDGESYTLTEKEDFPGDEDYILFDYEYVFDKNGTYSFRGGYDEDMVSGCTYSINNGILSMSASPLFAFEMNAYKIISNSGGTLVLEPTDVMLEINNAAFDLWGDEQIKKTVGTYKKR